MLYWWPLIMAEHVCSRVILFYLLTEPFFNHCSSGCIHKAVFPYRVKLTHTHTHTHPHIDEVARVLLPCHRNVSGSHTWNDRSHTERVGHSHVEWLFSCKLVQEVRNDNVQWLRLLIVEGKERDMGLGWQIASYATDPGRCYNWGSKTLVPTVTRQLINN